MISRVGSGGYTEGSGRVQRTAAQPTEARAQTATPREPVNRSAAVVRISNDARALASDAGSGDRARPLTGAAGSGADRARPLTSTETRATVEIEPVVAQPVPDFDVPEAPSAEPTDTAAAQSGAATRDAARTE